MALFEATMAQVSPSSSRWKAMQFLTMPDCVGVGVMMGARVLVVVVDVDVLVEVDDVVRTVVVVAQFSHTLTQYDWFRLYGVQVSYEMTGFCCY